MPGSYGQPPRGFRLPDGIRLGRVRLQVADLSRSLAFYQSVLGLRAVERDPGSAVLAAQGDDTPLVELRERAGSRPVPRRGALGLYHFAILLPDRPSLAHFVRNLGEIGMPTGAGDHLVSESLYLQDPDNLGIEVYADRPRSTWRRVGRELMMATDPVDIAGLLQLAGDVPWNGMPGGTSIGHLHLHVGTWSKRRLFTQRGLALIARCGTTPARCSSLPGVTTTIWAPTPGPAAAPRLQVSRMRGCSSGPSSCPTGPASQRPARASPGAATPLAREKTRRVTLSW